MFNRSPVTVHVDRATVYRTSDGGETVSATDPVGTVCVGQDRLAVVMDGVVLTVWPNGMVTLTTPSDDHDCDSEGCDDECDGSAVAHSEPCGITFTLPDRDVIANGVRSIPVSYL